MKPNNHIVAIFGGTGDLTYRKLLPAFYNLLETKSLPDSFHLVVIGRQELTTASYHDLVKPWLREQARFDVKEEILDVFLEYVSYFKMTFTEDEGYPRLKTYFETLDPQAQILYYFAVAPSFFETIATQLDRHQLVSNSKVIIEKPFGNDLKSAIDINNTLTHIFDEDRIFRIDHYVAKEMVQNIFTIRFSNMIFADSWNGASINNIQISAAETVGVENRGNYYDHTGALKDMFQNHLLQLLSIVLMEEPHAFNAADIHHEQEAVLESLYVEDYENDIVYGQYLENRDSKSYTHEDKVEPNSTTETYVALKLASSLPKWQDTPIYIRTGKRMHKRSTEIMIEFNQKDHEQPNVLIIKVQPDEGVYLRFNIKKPGQSHDSQTVFMDFCQSCNYENRENTPEAYERLLKAAMDSDQSLFASFKQVHLSWSLVETILEHKGNDKPEGYDAYSSGPKRAHDLLARDGNQWIEEQVMGEIFKY